MPWKPNIALRTSLETILLHFFMSGVRVVTRLRTSAESDCIPAIPLGMRNIIAKQRKEKGVEVMKIREMRRKGRLD